MSNQYTLEYENLINQPRKTKPVLKRREIFWLPLIFSALCYVLIPLRTSIISLLFMIIGPEDLVATQLKIELYRNYMLFALLFLPLIFCLLFYINMIVIVPMREKAELMRVSRSPDEDERLREYLEQFNLYTKLKSVRWQTHAFFYIILAAQLAIVMRGALFSSVPRETALLQNDLDLLRSETVTVYEGSFHPTDRPLDNTHGYVIIADEDFYYFTSGVGTLRCLKSNLTSSNLMQPWYRVEYLPGTYTVVSVTNAGGIVLTGTDGPSGANLPEGHWLHGDLIVRSRTEVYGYDSLTEDGQKAFDLFYGEYYSEGVAQAAAYGEEPNYKKLNHSLIHSFYLPQPIPKKEYLQVLALYKTATVRYSSPPWRYDTNDSHNIQKVYAGAVRSAILGHNTQFFEARDKAAEIVAAMPSGLGDAEKCHWITQYLLENVEYYTGETPQTEYQAGDDSTVQVLMPRTESTTAHGALIYGFTNTTGFVSAFAALAHQAGINSIYVVGEHTRHGRHEWNMVQIDGHWHHIDVTWIGIAEDWAYFLAGDDQIAQTHTPVSYGQCEFVPLPAAPFSIEINHI